MAYINYPNPHIELHSDPVCSSIKKQRKENQRTITLNLHSFETEISNFVQKKYRFAAEPAYNDMWLSVDFDDYEFERSLVLNRRHTEFHKVPLTKTLEF